jgi:uncharacterized protein
MTNKELIQRLYESFASGDIAAVTAAFADDIAWTEADGFPLAGTYIGPQAVVESVFMRLGEFSDNWGVVVDRLVADGDTIVALGKYTWNHKNSGGWPTCGRWPTVRPSPFYNTSIPQRFAT